MRLANPADPGKFVRMEIIEPLALSVIAAARVLGVTRPARSGAAQWPRRALARHGLARREGVRRQDGHAASHADELRYRRLRPARRRDPRKALSRAAECGTMEAAGRRPDQERKLTRIAFQSDPDTLATIGNSFFELEYSNVSQAYSADLLLLLETSARRRLIAIIRSVNICT